MCSSDLESEPVFVGNAALKEHASAEWLKLKMTAGGRQRDTRLAEVFIKELKDAEARGQWWDFMVMSLGENHTDGLTPGRFTPQACVASNDLALGLILDKFGAQFQPRGVGAQVMGEAADHLHARLDEARDALLHAVESRNHRADLGWALRAVGDGHEIGRAHV